MAHRVPHAHDALLTRAAQQKHPRRRSNLDPGELAQLLRQILEAPDGHRLFNAALKHRWFEVTKLNRDHRPPVRTLQGAHDVRAFVRAYANDLLAPFLQRFCRSFKKTRDVASSWAEVFPGQELPERRG